MDQHQSLSVIWLQARYATGSPIFACADWIDWPVACTQIRLLWCAEQARTNRLAGNVDWLVEGLIGLLVPDFSGREPAVMRPRSIARLASELEARLGPALAGGEPLVCEIPVSLRIPAAPVMGIRFLSREEAAERTWTPGILQCEEAALTWTPLRSRWGKSRNLSGAADIKETPPVKDGDPGKVTWKLSLRAGQQPMEIAVRQALLPFARAAFRQAATMPRAGE